MDFWSILRIVITVIFAICGLLLTVIVLLQEGKSAGLGTIGGAAETFWEKNKARSAEGKMERLTRYAAIGFFVFAFILAINF